jgi:hypothetical protein
MPEPGAVPGTSGAAFAFTGPATLLQVAPGH